MDLAVSTRYVLARAQLEAIRLGQEICPEHILLGILKMSELTAADIARGSRREAETDNDIAALRKIFADLDVNTAAARKALRQALRDAPPYGDGTSKTLRLQTRVEEMAMGRAVFPCDLLSALTAQPSPVLRTILNISP